MCLTFLGHADVPVEDVVIEKAEVA